MKNITVLLVAIFALMVGCSQPEVKINDDSNEQEIILSKKQVLIVSLKSNPTTGYAWETESLDETLLKQEEHVKFEPQSNLIGAPGVQIFKFIGVKSGTAELKMVYWRPWETNTRPIKVFTVRVTIR